MPERFRIATPGRYCIVAGEDMLCLADVWATDFIALRRLTEGPLPDLEARVTCRLDALVGVDGIVLHGRPGGFVLKIMVNPERRAWIEARLAWMRDADARTDRREAARIIPVHRNVRVGLLGARVMEAVVADMSMTGAALVLDERPEVGAVVTVGKRYATVVRHTPEEISVAFRLPFGPLTFNEQVIL